MDNMGKFLINTLFGNAIAIILASCIAVLAAFVVFTAATPFAHAEESYIEGVTQYAQVDDWAIMRSEKNQSCWATATYDNGAALGIHFLDGHINLIVAGVVADPGREYRTIVTTSNGDRGILTAIGLTKQVVTFNDLDPATAEAIGRASWVYIQGLTSFAMQGASKAMVSAMECYARLRSF